MNTEKQIRQILENEGLKDLKNYACFYCPNWRNWKKVEEKAGEKCQYAWAKYNKFDSVFQATHRRCLMMH